MMQYSTQQGVQGICPPDWHIPTDEEWKVLEGAVDSQYGIGNVEWEGWDEARGIDAGLNLKAIDDWYLNGNGSDLFGFSGLPGGARNGNRMFYFIGGYGSWWSSTENSSASAWFRFLSYEYGYVYVDTSDLRSGFSVRCLRD